jgi:hypothetical protein
LLPPPDDVTTSESVPIGEVAQVSKPANDEAAGSVGGGSE